MQRLKVHAGREYEHAVRIVENDIHLRAMAQTPLRQASSPCSHLKRDLVLAKCSSYIDNRLRSNASIALKEWAALVAAIGDGKQTILLRKGGIREGAFKPPSSSFYLFPTSFHSEGRLLKPCAEQAYSKVVLHSTCVQASMCWGTTSLKSACLSPSWCLCSEWPVYITVSVCSLNGLPCKEEQVLLQRLQLRCRGGSNG